MLRLFFGAADISTGSDWDNLTEGDHQSIYLAWLNMAPGSREQVEQMLRYVHETASSAGVQAFIAEAYFRNIDITASIGPLDGHHTKALWVLINHSMVFHTARLLLSVSNTFGRYWNLTPGIPHTLPDTDPNAVQNLKIAIASLYRREQARGHCCTIESYSRRGCLYLFVYLDDYTQTHTGHDDRGKLSRHPLRPTFEVVFVYNRPAGTLDLYAPGERRWRTTLRDLFCEHILHHEPPPAPADQPPYRMKGLLSRSFPLPTDSTAGVISATIRRLKLIPPRRARRVILEADPAAGEDIYDMLDDHFPADRFPREQVWVNQVTFGVKYCTSDDDRERSLTFTVSYPDACDLRNKPEDQRAVGEWCLRRWGILNDDFDDGTVQPDRVV